MKSINFIIISLFLIFNFAFAENGQDNSSHHENHENHENHDDHDDHDEGSSKSIGKGKAIEVVDEKKGFKLSEEAIKMLNLKFQNVNGDEFEIKKDSLVTSKKIKGVYRFRAGFFKLMTAQILKESKNKYIVKVTGLEFGDQIVINGLGLLRVTDVYSTDKSEYGHSH